MGCSGQRVADCRYYLDELKKAHQFFDNFYQDLPSINDKSKLLSNEIYEISRGKVTEEENYQLLIIEKEFKQCTDLITRIKK